MPTCLKLVRRGVTIREFGCTLEQWCRVAGSDKLLMDLVLPTTLSVVPKQLPLRYCSPVACLVALSGAGPAPFVCPANSVNSHTGAPPDASKVEE